jgi:hypothetical protein
LHPFVAGTSKLRSFGRHLEVAAELAQGAQRPARRSMGRFRAASEAQRQSSGRGGAPQGAAPSTVLHGRGNYSQTKKIAISDYGKNTQALWLRESGLVFLCLRWLGNELLGQLLSPDFTATARVTGCYTPLDFNSAFPQPADPNLVLHVLEALDFCVQVSRTHHQYRFRICIVSNNLLI